MTGQNILIAAVIALIVVAAGGIMIAFAPGATGPTPPARSCRCRRCPRWTG
ncbi:hypothetical protein [Methanoculleus chikugoensis]|uniref:hypothetical protein n=1 Tax=Methanoculleus chikugoensis TaxID=118126 RepID=UPI001FB29FDB|nr:hypothetical protein [Methanoculleus chikugoensis]